MPKTSRQRSPITKSDRIQLAFRDATGRRRVSSIRVPPDVRREWDEMFEEYRQLLPGLSRAQVLEKVFAEMDRIPFWRRFFEITSKKHRPAIRGRPPKHLTSSPEPDPPQNLEIQPVPNRPTAEIRGEKVQLPSWMKRQPRSQRRKVDGTR